MRKRPFLTITLLAFALMVSPLSPRSAMAEKPSQVRPNTDTASKTAQKTAEKTVNAFMTTLQELQWVPQDELSSVLSYRDALDKTLTQHLDIQLAKEKITETHSKEKSVKNKRLLLFFKYFNAQHLEEAAESDAQAATAHLDVVTQQALYDTTQYYFDIARALLSSHVKYQSIRQGLKQFQLDQRHFEQGDITNLTLLKTRVSLIDKYGTYLESTRQVEHAQLRLSQFMGEDRPMTVFPELLTFTKLKKGRAQEIAEFSLSLVPQTLLPPGLSVDNAIATALKHRPDLKEAQYRQDTFTEILKAKGSSFDPHHRNIIESAARQRTLKTEQIQRGVEAMVTQAVHDVEDHQQHTRLAYLQYDIAQTNVRQVGLSVDAGFRSEKDRLDAKVALVQAQANWLSSQLDARFSEVQLLHQMGVISRETLSKGFVMLPAAQELL